MTKDYVIMFDGVVDRDRLYRAMAELGVPRGRVLFREDGLNITIEDPVAVLEIESNWTSFNQVLNCYAELVTFLGKTDVELALFLAPRLGLRCLLDDHTTSPSRWVLVTPEGGSGVVYTEDDDDEGDLRIEFATVPILGAPELPVEPEIDWSAE